MKLPEVDKNSKAEIKSVKKILYTAEIENPLILNSISHLIFQLFSSSPRRFYAPTSTPGGSGPYF